MAHHRSERAKFHETEDSKCIPKQWWMKFRSDIVPHHWGHRVVRFRSSDKRHPPRSEQAPFRYFSCFTEGIVILASSLRVLPVHGTSSGTILMTTTKDVFQDGKGTLRTYVCSFFASAVGSTLFIFPLSYASQAHRFKILLITKIGSLNVLSVYIFLGAAVAASAHSVWTLIDELPCGRVEVPHDHCGPCVGTKDMSLKYRHFS